MLQGINILQFYIDRKYTRWERTDVREFCVAFYTGYLAPFVFAVDDVTVDTFLLTLYDENDVEINSSSADNVIDNETYKTFNFTAKVLADKTCGYYYYKLEYGVGGLDNVHYSEMFGWVDDSSEMFSINMSSENVTLGGIYNMPWSGLNLQFYLFYNGVSILNEIVEDGVEKPYGNIPVFNTLNIKRTAEINGTTEIFRFLSALRVFSINGEVTVFDSGVLKSVYDIITETKDDNNFGDTIIINFSFKEQDFLSTRNAI